LNLLFLFDVEAQFGKTAETADVLKPNRSKAPSTAAGGRGASKLIQVASTFKLVRITVAEFH